MTPKRLAGALAVLLLAGGCASGGSGDDTAAKATTTTTTNSPARADKGLVASMLATYPAADASEDQVQVEVLDLAEVRRLNAAPTVGPAADSSATRADLLALVPQEPGAKASADVPPAARRATTVSYADFRATFGWSLPEVQSFVTALPPHPTIMKGAFDQAALTAALGAPTAGVWAKGDPGSNDFEHGTPANPMGESVRIAYDGTFLVQGLDDESTAAAAKAAGGQGPTMADDKTFTALASALDDAHVYGALLVRRSSFTPRPGRSTAAASATPLPARFTGIAAGGAADASGPITVLAWAHPDTDSAAKNAAAIKRLLATGTSDTGKTYAELFETLDVKTTGSTVTARLRPKGQAPRIWLDFLVRGEEPIQTHK